MIGAIEVGDTEERNRRLLLLASFLETLPPRRFKFGVWLEGWDGVNKPMDCGTVCCAFGWAPSVPELHEAGLRIMVSGAGVDRLDAPPSYGFVHATFYIDGDENPDGFDNELDVAERFFGLESKEAEYLFLPGGWLANRAAAAISNGLGAHTTAQQVAYHIRLFVRDGMVHRGPEL